MTVIDELVAANVEFQGRFDYGHLPRRPSRSVAVLTCIDARVDLYSLLGLKPGEANLIRTAGGRAADAIRSLVVATQLLGVREIAVVHHTDCGMLTIGNDDIREMVRTGLGEQAGLAAAEMDFLTISNLTASVRQDVSLIRHSSMIPDDVLVRGFVYHVEDGRLEEIDVT